MQPFFFYWCIISMTNCGWQSVLAFWVFESSSLTFCWITSIPLYMYLFERPRDPKPFWVIFIFYWRLFQFFVWEVEFDNLCILCSIFAFLLWFLSSASLCGTFVPFIFLNQVSFNQPASKFGRIFLKFQLPFAFFPTKNHHTSLHSARRTSPLSPGMRFSAFSSSDALLGARQLEVETRLGGRTVSASCHASLRSINFWNKSTTFS